jgi:hypothetical protein
MPSIKNQAYEKVKLSYENNAITQQTLARIKQVAKMIAKGKSRMTCLEFMVDTYGIKESQAEKYYRATLRYLAAQQQDDGSEAIRTKLVTLLEGQIEELNGRDSVEARKAAQSAADLIAKLNALYTEKKDVTLTGDVTFEFGAPDNDEV